MRENGLGCPFYDGRLVIVLLPCGELCCFPRFLPLLLFVSNQGIAPGSGGDNRAVDRTVARTVKRAHQALVMRWHRRVGRRHPPEAMGTHGPFVGRGAFGEENDIVEAILPFLIGADIEIAVVRVGIERDAPVFKEQKIPGIAHAACIQLVVPDALQVAGIEGNGQQCGQEKPEGRCDPCPWVFHEPIRKEHPKTTVSTRRNENLVNY